MLNFKGYDIILVIVLAVILGYSFAMGITFLVAVSGTGVLIYLFKWIIAIFTGRGAE